MSGTVEERSIVEPVRNLIHGKVRQQAAGEWAGAGAKAELVGGSSERGMEGAMPAI